MAELLVRWTDHTHPDPDVDRRGSYKRGYVISVQPDDHEWGRKESKQRWLAEGFSEEDWHGRTVILKLPNRSAAALSILAQTQQGIDDNGSEYTRGRKNLPGTYRRREWGIALDNFPPGLLKKLDRDGEITFGAAELTVRNGNADIDKDGVQTTVVGAITRVRDGLGFDPPE